MSRPTSDMSCCALSEWHSSVELCTVSEMLRQNAPGSVGVKLNPRKAWSYRCKLSIDAVQTLQAAPPSSQPVRLVFDRLVRKISNPKTSSNCGKRRLDLWAVASDECKFVITHFRGGGRGLAKFFHVGSELCSFVGNGDLLTALVPILTDLDTVESIEKTKCHRHGRHRGCCQSCFGQVPPVSVTT